MLALADRLSRGRQVALAIAQHARKADIDPLPLLRAAQAMGLTFGPDEFRALLEEGSLPEEQVPSVPHLILAVKVVTHGLIPLDWQTMPGLPLAGGIDEEQHGSASVQADSVQLCLVRCTCMQTAQIMLTGCWAASNWAVQAAS